MPRTKHPSEEVFHSLVGDWPEDVIIHLDFASDTLFQLEEVFKTIGKEANNPRIQHLAKLGAHVANDVAERVGCQYDSMLNRLQAAGVIPVEGERP